MSKSCASKNTPIYKMLLKQLGSNEAVQYLYAYNGNKFPPTVMTLTELKKTLGIRNNLSSLAKAKMALRIAEYNKKNNTSHRFVDIQNGQSDSYKIIFIPNYLPRDEAKAQQKAFAKKGISTNYIDRAYGNADIVYKSDNGIVYGDFSSNEFIHGSDIFPTLEDALKDSEKDTLYQEKPVVYSRYNKTELQGLERGGKILKTIYNELYNLDTEGLDQDDTNEAQEDRILEIAEREGFLFDEADVAFREKYGDPIGSGQESIVFDKGDGKVVKVTITTQYRDLLDFIDGVVLRNAHFPETALTVTGVGIDSEGSFVVISEQNKIDVEREATEEEIAEFIAPFNLTQSEVFDHRKYNEDFIISDLAPRNVVVDTKGNIQVLDPLMHLNTPVWNENGTRGEDIAIDPTTDVEGVFYNKTLTTKQALGAYDSLNNIIFALTDPNISTFPHELAHMFLNNMIKNNNLEDLNAVLSWVNEQRQNKGLKPFASDWFSLNTKNQKEVHEYFANGFTVYLAENRKTTNAKMNSIFESFAKWVKDIIDSIKEILGIELNDTIREVYDKILNLQVVEEKPIVETPITEEDNIKTSKPKSKAKPKVTPLKESDVKAGEEIDEDYGGYPVYVKGKVIGHLYEEDEGFVMRDEDFNEINTYGPHADIEEALELYIETYNDNLRNQNPIDEQEEPVKQKKTKDPKDIYYTISLTIAEGTTILVDVKLIDETADDYTYQDIHGNVYTINKKSSRPQPSTSTAYKQQFPISTPEPQYKKGNIVAYVDENSNEQEAIIADVISGFENGEFIIKYMTSKREYINEKNIIGTTVDEEAESKRRIEQHRAKHEFIKHIERIAAHFNNLFGDQFILDIDYFPNSNFKGIARFVGGNFKEGVNGKIEVHLQNIEGLEDTINFAEVITHEFMHPFVEALSISNTELYDNLIHELHNTEHKSGISLYDYFYNELERTDQYDMGNSSSIDKEILTRYLGRRISKVFNKNGTVNIDYVTKLGSQARLFSRFLAWLKDIIDFLLGRKDVVNSFDKFVDNINNRGFKESKKELFDDIKNIVDSNPALRKLNTTSSKSFHEQFFSRWAKNAKNVKILNDKQEKEKTTLSYREAILSLTSEEVYNKLEEIYNNYNKSTISDKFEIVFAPTINNTVEISQTENGYYVQIDPAIENYGRGLYNIIKQFARQSIKDEEDFKDFLKIIEKAYFLTNQDKKQNLNITVNEINPLLSLNDITAMMSINLSQKRVIEEANSISYRMDKVINEAFDRIEEGVSNRVLNKEKKAKLRYLARTNNYKESDLEFIENNQEWYSKYKNAYESATASLREEQTMANLFNRLPQYGNFRIEFTPAELEAIYGLEEHFHMAAKQADLLRGKIVSKLEKLEQLSTNYKSDTLKYEYNRIKFLNKKYDETQSAEFLKEYAVEAATSLGYAYRKFIQITKDVKDRQGKIGRAEINRLNKEFIVVRQLLGFHEQFTDVVRNAYDKTDDMYIKALKATSWIDQIKDALDDTTVALAVEWLLPYAEQHNKFMAKEGYINYDEYNDALKRLEELKKEKENGKDVDNEIFEVEQIINRNKKYIIDAKLIRDHLKYGVGEDVGYVSYWLGSNVTSRNLLNALVANTVNQDLMLTNFDIQNASMDINIAFRQFLKEKGFNNLTSTQATEYYKKHYLRKATVAYREYNKTTDEYVDTYIDKWALHQEYYWDLFDKDLAEFKKTLPEPKSQKEWEENDDKIIEWKKAQGFEIVQGKPILKNPKYKNPQYEKLKSDPLFKVLEEKYNEANVKYGENKLKYGIIPQKYDTNIFKRIRETVKDIKDYNEVSAKAKVIRDKLVKNLQAVKEDTVSINLDGTLMRSLNSTLSTLKDDANLDLSLHEIITDFVSEGYRYGALKETQYNAENLMLLLEGNTFLGIEGRVLSNIDTHTVIRTKEQYDNVKKELQKLEIAESKGEAVDKDYMNKLRAIIKRGIVKKSLRDKLTGKVLDSKQELANKQLIAQVADIYFGESLSKDWIIESLNNMSAAKLAEYVSVAESTIRMGGNLIAAANNVVMGNVQMFIEAHGGKYYNKRTLAKAFADYMSNIHNYIMDTKNPIKTKDAQLAIAWDAIQGEVQDEFGRRVTGSLASKFFTMNSVFFATAAGEHALQLTNMKAMAMYKKVTTQSGEKISLYDAYVVDKNGRYSLRTDLVDFTKEDLLKFMRDLQGVNRMLNGNYSSFNKTMLQRQWYGNLLMKFRKWMYPSFRARWGKERIDYERNIVEVGYLRYFFLDYLKNHALRLFKRDNNLDKKGPLEPHEKYAIRKAMMELGIYLSIAILATMLFGSEDEPKELNSTEKFLLLTLVRLNQDLEIYNGGIPKIAVSLIPGSPVQIPNPQQEALKILRNPSASINTIAQITKVINQLADPTAVYQQSGPGYKKGESKLWINTRKLLPFKQFLDIYEGRFEGTLDNQLGYYEMINRGIEGVKVRKSTM